jgi:hypothetical protein
MVAAWLGLLPRIMSSYPEVIIPAGALQELFEGRARIREVQKSRIERARQIQDAVARGALKVLPSVPTLRDPLDSEIGPDLAALLRAAKAANGVVVRPAPVKRPGLDEERDADLTAYCDVLTDTQTVLASLVSRGAVDQATENVARNYFNLQDKGWSSPVAPNPKAPIYVDELALIYLQTVNLLEFMTQAFSEVYIHPSVSKEADSLIDYANQTRAVLEIVDDIRTAVGDGYKSGKVQRGPHRKPSRDEGDTGPTASTLNLISDALNSDVVVIDDRALNREAFITDILPSPHG